MVWFTWRQHRLEAIFGAIVVLLVIGITVMTGIIMKNVYDQTAGLTNCVVASSQCFQAFTEFNQKAMQKAFGGSSYYYMFLLLLYALPLLFGLFVGAPAGAREFEQGTYRLAWTQGVPWYRWLAIKVGLLAMVIGCAFLILSVFLWWWSIPLNNVVSTIWSFYDMQSITLTSYAIFACMLGIAAGILVRKTVPAMAITLIIFIALRMAIALFWRPYFLPPIVDISSFSSITPLPAHARGLKYDIIDRQGNALPNSSSDICAAATSYPACMDEHGYKLRTLYQSKERFWLFQVFEGGIYLFLSAGLFVFSYWWVKHKII